MANVPEPTAVVGTGLVEVIVKLPSPTAVADSAFNDIGWPGYEPLPSLLMLRVSQPISSANRDDPSAVAVNAGSVLMSYGRLLFCGLVTENTIVGYMPGAVLVTLRMLYWNACAATLPGITCTSATAPA